MVTTLRAIKPPVWVAYVAAAWAFGHAALSAYWAAGGTLGIAQLSEGIQEQAELREPWFIVLVWGVAALKSLAGVIALALARPWGQLVPRWLLLAAAWGAGVILAGYGALGILPGLLITFDIIESPGTPEPAYRWYLLLWYPLYLIGGLLFLIAAWRATVDSRDR